MSRVKAPAHTDNDIKSVYALKVFFAYLSIALLAGRVTLNFQLALGIFFTYFFWNLFWIKILVQSPNIYSLRVPTTIIDDWIQVSIPSADGPRIRKDRVVTSISELSGIRGAHMMVSLRIMSALMSTLALVAIHVDLHYRNAVFLNIKSGADMVPVCMFLFIFGSFCVGHFELNLMDKLHSYLHYVGVLLLLTGTLCIGFVTNWSLLSIVMIVIEFGMCFLWFWISAKVQLKSDDIRVVTRNSKLCIGIELAMFQVTNLIIMFTVHALGPNEGNIWVSPFTQ